MEERRFTVQPYDLATFFEDENDDQKLLASITNEFSMINSVSQDKWWSIAKMILSRRNYRGLLNKFRYLVEDIHCKNYPFYYEKKGRVF